MTTTSETQTTETETKRKRTLLGGDQGERATLIDPSDEHIVLVTDKDHPLYNPRVHYGVNEGLALSMSKGGQQKPIILRKNGEDYEVVDGRQEVIACRWVNKLYDEGKLPKALAHVAGHLKLSMVVRQYTSNAELVRAMNKADASIKDDPVTIAERMLHSKQYLGNNKAVAESFGLDSETTVANYLELLNLDDTVKDAVKLGPEKGGIPMHVAKRFSSMPRDKQKALLVDMKTAGVTTGAAAQAAITAVKKGKAIAAVPTSGRKMMNRAFIESLADEVLNVNQPGKNMLSNTLKAVLGDDNAKKALPPEIKDAWKKALKASK